MITIMNKVSKKECLSLTVTLHLKYTTVVSTAFKLKYSVQELYRIETI